MRTTLNREETTFNVLAVLDGIQDVGIAWIVGKTGQGGKWDGNFTGTGFLGL